MSIHSKVEDLLIKEREINAINTTLREKLDEFSRSPEIQELKMKLEMLNGEHKRDFEAIMKEFGFEEKFSPSQLLDKALNYKSGIIV